MCRFGARSRRGRDRPARCRRRRRRARRRRARSCLRRLRDGRAPGRGRQPRSLVGGRRGTEHRRYLRCVRSGAARRRATGDLRQLEPRGRDARGRQPARDLRARVRLGRSHRYAVPARFAVRRLEGVRRDARALLQRQPRPAGDVRADRFDHASRRPARPERRAELRLASARRSAEVRALRGDLDVATRLRAAGARHHRARCSLCRRVRRRRQRDALLGSRAGPRDLRLLAAGRAN